MTDSKTPSVEVVPLLPQVRKTLEKTGVKLGDVLAVVKPAVVDTHRPATLPVPTQITDAQAAALARLPEVYGQVVPSRPRKLTTDEVSSLLVERLTVDEIVGMLDRRKIDIRTTVVNHLDCEWEEDEHHTGAIPRDKEGHILVTAKVTTPGQEKCFSWEVGNRGASLTESGLADLEAAGIISHEEYLSLTTPVRVLDENKTLLAIKKNPELAEKLAQAVTPGSKVGSFYVRKA